MPRTRKRPSVFVPRIVLGGLVVGVVPACVLVACDDKQIFSLAVLAFDAHADVEAGDANGDADGPMVIALAQIGFDADADAVGSDASEAGDADADATD